MSGLHGAEIALLKLKDGRVFENWKITGSSAQSVTIRYKGGFAQVSKSLLPEPVASQYPIDADQLAAEKAADAESQRLAQIRAYQLSEARKLRQEQTAVPSHFNAAKGAAAGESGGILALVSETARKGAIRYFRFDFDSTARNRAFSVQVDVEPEEPEQWAGYPGRYTVKGKAFIRYYDWYWNTSTRLTTKEYTVLIDATGTVAKVAEVRIR